MKDPICPKCKKPLKPCDHHMMGIDKKCFDCHVNWTYRLGFKDYKSNPENVCKPLFKH